MKKVALIVSMLAGLAVADDPRQQLQEDAMNFSKCHGAWVAGLEMIKNENEMENTRKRMESERVNFESAAYIAFAFMGKKEPSAHVEKVSEKTKLMLLSEYEISKKIGAPLDEFNKIGEKCVKLKEKAAYFHEEFIVEDCLSSDSCFSDLQ
ncbi:MAG: hypothetical protein KFB92_15375 [Alcanivorax sp.]|nr:MAG: hypothetical protein KFB92_15375 [Alcanivorax sp.]